MDWLFYGLAFAAWVLVIGLVVGDLISNGW